MSPIHLRPFTDLGNAETLVAEHGGEMKWAQGIGRLVWHGAVWERDDTREWMRLASRTVRRMYARASSIDDEKLRAALVKHARASESKSALAAMCTLAESLDEIATVASDWDADPMVFAVDNGVIDLETGRVHLHQRDNLITRMSPVVYDPTATCPTWDRFLVRVVPDADVRSYLARLVGYTLTGLTREHCLAFAHGPGSNGKSVLLGAIRELMGDYAVKAPRSLLMASRNERHPTEMMPLRGARLAWCSEIDETAQWDESKVKDLASDDPITARAMHQDHVTWAPTHKLWIAGNHKPRVRGTDDGIWRRLRLIPFEVVIADGEKDKSLSAKLAAELPGILAWAVRGCLEWQRDGLGMPAAVDDATRAYRAEQDAIGRYVADCCVRGESLRAAATPLYSAYREWATANGEHPVSQRRFGEWLGANGYRQSRLTDGKSAWAGIGLRAAQADSSRWAS